MPNRKRRERRKRSLWPLPGGEKSYAESLRKLLLEAREEPTRDDMARYLKRAFKGVQSEKAARSYIAVLETLGFVSLSRNRIQLTTEGAAFLQNEDTEILRKALLERIYGVQEIWELVRDEPLRIGILHKRLRQRGFSWKTQSQVRYRLRWMEAADLVERKPATAYGGYVGYKATQNRDPRSGCAQ